MRLTKFTHACVRLDDGDRALVIDPGTFSEAATALDGAAAVLITHEHFDHLDTDALLAAARSNSELRVWGPRPALAGLRELGDRATAVGAGESFEAAGFAVRTFGGKHAVIHPSLGTPCENLGYLVDDTVYHPGDAFDVPPVTVDTLLVPLQAPWSKLAEVIDFAVSVRAPKAFQIHDAMLSDAGARNAAGRVEQFGAEYGTKFRYLTPGEQVEI